MAEMTPERFPPARLEALRAVLAREHLLSEQTAVELLDALACAQKEIVDLRERVEYAIGYIESTEDTLRRGYSGALVADTLKLGLLPDLRAALASRTPGEKEIK
jgi:hypothetical protein